GRTAITQDSSILTITVVASSFPGICARAAIPCAVKAGEWEMTMYLTLWLSRNSPQNRKWHKKPPASATFSRGLINVAMTPITCLEYLIIVRSGEVFGYSRG